MNTNYWLNSIMSNMYVNGNLYLGLSSTMPAKNGTGATEPSGGGYARVKVSGLTTPNNGVVYNGADIVFPKSTSSWFSGSSKVAYWVLYDGNGSSAHVLSAGALDEAKTIESNTVITIPTNSISFTIEDKV